MSIYYLEYVMHRHYAMEYIGRDKLKEALAHLQQARALLMKYGMYNYEIELKTIYGSYYQHSKQYNKALAILILYYQFGASGIRWGVTSIC